VRDRNAVRHLSIAAIASSLVLFAASPSLAGTDRVRADGPTFVYNPDHVPATATARVQAVYNAAGDTIVTLQVRGMKPNHHFGAHAHVGECGTNPLAAGGHFQNVPNPSTDPADAGDLAYANPSNEIWLDFETDEDGNAVAQTRVGWQFSPERAAKSVIIHERHTSTGHGDGTAGTAGGRMACISVPF
jgi:superoxide dismutase, Cu-Zn family